MAFLLRTNAADTSSPPSPAAPAPAVAADPVQIFISVPDQRLELVRDGEWIARFPISTSKFGTGDNYGSYRTPLGQLKVCDKIGGDLAPGAVIRHRSATGEVLPVNAPGRDPIVTRVIWLDGVEQQNKNARARGIYIHGTPEERTIGTPTSYGCIRMKSKDVIRVFEEVPVGTLVDIMPSKLPHLRRYVPPKVQPAPAEAPVSAEEIAASKTSAEKAMIAGASPRDNAPSSAQKKTVAEIAKSMTLINTDKKSAVAATKPVSKPAANTTLASAAPLPAIAENTAEDHSSASAWRALKGSFLLANIPSVDSDKDDHRKKDTQ